MFQKIHPQQEDPDASQHFGDSEKKDHNYNVSMLKVNREGQYSYDFPHSPIPPILGGINL